ncbi:MAG: cobalamin-dependent protein [Nitrospirota bacterium]
MKVLLINPNRYKSPPVPPIGLEYIAGFLERESEGHDIEITDLCFSENPEKDIGDAVTSFKPEVVGITVRNVDSVLYHTNEFFLDEIRDIVRHIKKNYGLKVIIGGSSVLTNPQGVLNYLDADYAVVGPGESIINKLLNEVSRSENEQIIFSGRFRTDTPCRRNPFKTDYRTYFDKGGIAGFETHKGCSSSCVYCLEANSGVFFRNIDSVISEIRLLVERGFRHFHLCDSEFNEDLLYSIEFCTSLIKANLDIIWTAYMKPGEFNKKLLKLMKESGVYLITLTVDSYQKCPAYWSDIEKFVFTAKPLGLKVAVDFLTGFPYESEKHVLECLEILKRLQPDSVSVNTYIRLYKRLAITNIVMKDKRLKENLIGDIHDHTLVKPVFYNSIGTEKLERMISAGYPFFRIEGLEKVVNYIRI